MNIYIADSYKDYTSFTAKHILHFLEKKQEMKEKLYISVSSEYDTKDIYNAIADEDITKGRTIVGTGRTTITVTVGETDISDKKSIIGYIKGVTGDVNCDGVVNSDDAEEALNLYRNNSKITEDVLARADIDGNGSIDSMDASLIYDLRYYLK